MSFYMGIILISIALSGVTSFIVKIRFTAGQKLKIQSGLTGAEVAMAILANAGIRDVRVQETRGFLADHYNPINKTLNLSKEVYHGVSASAAGVAAHEVGHAIQHAENYFPMWLRSYLVPAANIGSHLGPWLVILGLIIMGLEQTIIGQNMAIAGVILFGAATLFTLVTVPVEFDASARAKKILSRLEIIRPGKEYNTVSGVLFAAGLTYVAAAVTAVLQLLYWAHRAGLIGGRRN